MRHLVLETSTFTASVAVVEDARVLAIEEARVTTHSESLLRLVDEALHTAGLAPEAIDAIACGVGPGSFTGLRIGLATAKGLCFALGKPLIAVSSLAALALEAEERAVARASMVLALLDARRGEVYAGLFCMKGAEPPAVVKEGAVPPGRLASWLAMAAAEASTRAPVIVLGEGALAYPEAASACGEVASDLRATPSARAVAAIAARSQGPGRTPAAMIAVATATPHYIRPSEAEAKRMDLSDIKS